VKQGPKNMRKSNTFQSQQLARFLILQVLQYVVENFKERITHGKWQKHCNKRC
jgi:hypothetical protein